MRRVATRVVETGSVTKEYKVTTDHAGDVMLSCRTLGSDVLRPDLFPTPRSMRSWLSGILAIDVTEMPVTPVSTGIEFSARCIRAFADRLPAEMPDLSAQDALRMVADILDGGSSATQVTTGARIIPIRGVVADGKVIHVGGHARRCSP